MKLALDCDFGTSSVESLGPVTRDLVNFIFTFQRVD
jgi:hypothetical protein